MDLVSMEARQLGFLFREGDIDRVFAKYERFLLLLIQLLSAEKEDTPAGTILHVSQAT